MYRTFRQVFIDAVSVKKYLEEKRYSGFIFNNRSSVVTIKANGDCLVREKIEYKRSEDETILSIPISVVDNGFNLEIIDSFVLASGDKKLVKFVRSTDFSGELVIELNEIEGDFELFYTISNYKNHFGDISHNYSSIFKIVPFGKHILHKTRKMQFKLVIENPDYVYDIWPSETAAQSNINKYDEGSKSTKFSKSNNGAYEAELSVSNPREGRSYGFRVAMYQNS